MKQMHILQLLLTVSEKLPLLYLWDKIEVFPIPVVIYSSDYNKYWFRPLISHIMYVEKNHCLSDLLINLTDFFRYKTFCFI